MTQIGRVYRNHRTVSIPTVIDNDYFIGASRKIGKVDPYKVEGLVFEGIRVGVGMHRAIGKSNGRRAGRPRTNINRWFQMLLKYTNKSVVPSLQVAIGQ